MGFLGVVLGAVFVQSGALIAEFSLKRKENLNMAFFDSVIDFSFPVMPLILTYLAMFGLKTPIPHVDKSYDFIEFNFPSIEEVNGAKVVRKKGASTFIFAPKCKKNLENKSFPRSALCQKWGEYCEYLHNS